MRTGLILAAVLPALFIGGCKKTSDAPAPDAPTKQTVKAGCALCIFEMKDVTACELAVEIDGKAYRVSGKTMDDLGDAHAEDGLCSIARKAEVKGKLDGDRFAVTEMALLPK